MKLEDVRRALSKADEEIEARKKKLEELRTEWLEEQGLNPHETSKTSEKYYDHPNTMEDGTATFFWIVAMVVGAIFKGNWVIWIIATTVWLRFITRHKK